MCTWFAGAPGLHRPLDKLLGTWAGVFPQALLADIQARVAAARAAAAPPPALQPTLQPPGYGAGGGYGQAAPPPMAADPRLAQQQQQQQPVPMQPMQAALYPQPQVAPPAYGGYAQPPMQAPLNYPQQYAATAADPLALPPQQAAAPAAAQQASVPDLLASLMSAGLLAAPGAAPAAAAPGPELTGNAVPAAAAARATPEREQPATTTFTPERLKVQTRAQPTICFPGGPLHPLSTIACTLVYTRTRPDGEALASCRCRRRPASQPAIGSAGPHIQHRQGGRSRTHALNLRSRRRRLRCLLPARCTRACLEVGYAAETGPGAGSRWGAPAGGLGRRHPAGAPCLLGEAMRGRLLKTKGGCSLLKCGWQGGAGGRCHHLLRL